MDMTATSKMPVIPVNVPKNQYEMDGKKLEPNTAWGGGDKDGRWMRTN